MSELAVIPNKVTRHAYVKVRHSPDCPARLKEKPYEEAGQLIYPEFGVHEHCRCRKWVFKYDSSVSTETERESAQTRDWAEAERKAQEWMDQFNPDKVENKRLREQEAARNAADAAKTVTIEEAIGQFLNNKIYVEKREPGTIESLQTVMGYVDPKSFEVRRPGRLLLWLETQSPRPTLVSDLTPIMVESFLASWKVSETTNAHDFGKIKQFFNYCLKHKWIPENPLALSKRPSIKKGNRTGAFEPEQWMIIRDYARAAVMQAEEAEEAAVRKAMAEGAVKEVKAAEQAKEELEEAQRLLAFIELLRWSGMALIDATLFSFEDAPKCRVDANGVLTYERTKTDKIAITGLPAHVLDLLRNIPIGRASSRHPFLEKGKRGQAIEVESVENYWWQRLTELHKAAGIGKIKTDIGTYKNPGAHVYRDTFAVGIICSGINDSIQVAAKALGDTVKMVEDHYSPWIQQMKSKQAQDSNTAIAAQLRQLKALEAEKQLAGVIEIGGRR